MRNGAKLNFRKNASNKLQQFGRDKNKLKLCSILSRGEYFLYFPLYDARGNLKVDLPNVV
jgi:hypothetical protein